eukprot:382150-Prymnesium_polylepis.1
MSNIYLIRLSVGARQRFQRQQKPGPGSSALQSFISAACLTIQPHLDRQGSSSRPKPWADQHAALLL